MLSYLQGEEPSRRARRGDPGRLVAKRWEGTRGQAGPREASRLPGRQGVSSRLQGRGEGDGEFRRMFPDSDSTLRFLASQARPGR